MTRRITWTINYGYDLIIRLRLFVLKRLILKISKNLKAFEKYMIHPVTPHYRNTLIIFGLQALSKDSFVLFITNEDC
jgi:hypothetical protein